MSTTSVDARCATALSAPGVARLLERIPLTREQIAVRIDITARTLRNYADPNANRRCPYTVQFALETLADDFTD